MTALTADICLVVQGLKATKACVISIMCLKNLASCSVALFVELLYHVGRVPALHTLVLQAWCYLLSCPTVFWEDACTVHTSATSMVLFVELLYHVWEDACTAYTGATSIVLFVVMFYHVWEEACIH